MPITVAWDDEQKCIIIFTFEGCWGWEDFYSSIEQANALMESVHHSVHILIDMQNSRILPQSMLSHLRQLPKISIRTLVQL